MLRLVRLGTLLLVALGGLFGIFVFVAGGGALFGLLLLGLAIGGGIGLFRDKVTKWVVVDLVVLFLLFAGAILPSTTFVTARQKRAAHECFLRMCLEDAEIDTIDFSPPATLQDAIKFFKERSLKSNSFDDSNSPLEIVVEAKSEDYKTRPLPVIAVRKLSFYEAIRQVADRAGFEMAIRDKQVILKERSEK